MENSRSISRPSAPRTTVTKSYVGNGAPPLAADGPIPNTAKNFDTILDNPVEATAASRAAAAGSGSVADNVTAAADGAETWARWEAPSVSDAAVCRGFRSMTVARSGSSAMPASSESARSVTSTASTLERRDVPPTSVAGASSATSVAAAASPPEVLIASGGATSSVGSDTCGDSGSSDSEPSGSWSSSSASSSSASSSSGSSRSGATSSADESSVDESADGESVDDETAESPAPMVSARVEVSELASPAVVSSAGSAAATAGATKPTPSATASAPTRPTNRP